MAFSFVAPLGKGLRIMKRVGAAGFYVVSAFSLIGGVLLLDIWLLLGVLVPLAIQGWIFFDCRSTMISNNKTFCETKNTTLLIRKL
jgi:hypothetical protein